MTTNDNIFENLATAATHAARRGHADIAEMIENVMESLRKREPSYSIHDLVLAITMDDIINNMDNFKLKQKQIEYLRNCQRSIEKAYEWALMEQIWDVAFECCTELLKSNGMPVKEH